MQRIQRVRTQQTHRNDQILLEILLLRVAEDITISFEVSRETVLLADLQMLAEVA